MASIVNAQLSLEGIGSCIVTLASPGKMELPLDQRPSRGDRLQVSLEYVVIGVGDDEDFDNNGIGTGEADLLIRTQPLAGTVTVRSGQKRAEIEAEWEKRAAESRTLRSLA